jgi:hypothetical protein
MKCIFLFSFVLKPSHEVALENFVDQAHVQSQYTFVDSKKYFSDVAKYSMTYFATQLEICHVENEYTKSIS